jgi:phosphoserine aminotransferase
LIFPTKKDDTNSITSVYIIGRVLQKLLKTYPNKVEGQQAISDKKAQLIYDAVEAFPEVYRIIPNKAVRSRVNICFRVTKGGDIDAAEKAFLAEGTAQGLTGLKGHRSMGGMRLLERFINPLIILVFVSSHPGRVVLTLECRIGIRASNYNSVTLEGAEKLVRFIRAFATS